jgi:hypothetical protein
VNRGRVAAQPRDEVGHLLRLAEAVQRVQRGDRRPRGFGDVALDEAGLDEAGPDRVDADAVRRVVERGGLRSS